MRRQRWLPLRFIEDRFLRELASVEQYGALGVATKEVAPCVDEQNTRPAMSMNGHDLAGRKLSLDYAHAFVLEYKTVVSRGSDERIQGIGPTAGRYV